MTFATTIKTATVRDTEYTIEHIFDKVSINDDLDEMRFMESWRIISSLSGSPYGQLEGTYYSRSGAYKAFKRMTRN